MQKELDYNNFSAKNKGMMACSGYNGTSAIFAAFTATITVVSACVPITDPADWRAILPDSMVSVLPLSFVSYGYSQSDSLS